jgi:CMP-N-acetylneuraminate monooxygenase
VNDANRNHSTMREPYGLGPEESFTTLPAPVVVRGRSYFLARSEEGYHLLSTTCPHQGGVVVDAQSCFECPHHGWRFDRATGVCLNAPGQRLASLPVTASNGQLSVELPAARRSRGARGAPRLAPQALTMQLHSHACLEIVRDGFSLLTDPWLCGPAFYGAWMHYPPPIVDAASLRPNAIVITHEHPDHFHEPTLRCFDRSVPVLVPDFPNRRMVGRLEQSGFVNVRPLPFGEPVALHPDITVTCFEPESLWNDAIVLFDIGGFRILNINDAGLNHRIAAQVAPVDVVAAQFSTGASGYPLTWSHLADETKIHIMERSCRGKLRMLREAVDLYGSDYLLPFASHFALWHPSHRDFARMTRKNTLDDVLEAFSDSDVRVIDLLAGEVWDVPSDSIRRVWPDRRVLLEQSAVLEYVERRFDAAEFAEHHPTREDLTRAELEAYFLRLNDTAEVAFCEDLTVTVRASSARTAATCVTLSFEVLGGVLRLLPEPPPAPNLVIDIPIGLLQDIVTNNMSWDDATIGYWCRFKRSPDVYHAGFWRLLQAPYFQRPIDPGHAGSLGSGVSRAAVIGDLIEQFGPAAERVLRRYGLYCTGCHRSAYDTIEHAARQHGIEAAAVDRLVVDLDRVVGGGLSAGSPTAETCEVEAR